MTDEIKDKKKAKRPKMKITFKHRHRLIYYLNEFYKRYPQEKFTVFHFVKYFKARLKNNKDAWMGVSGETGCQPAGSKVLMADGSFKNIEDIKVGDVVLSPQEDGHYVFAPIIKTYKWDSHTNYKIIEGTRRNQELFECSYNHELPTYKFLPKSSRWALKYYTAEEYSKLSDATIRHLNIPTLKNNKSNNARENLPNRYSIKAIPCKGSTVYGFTIASESSWYLNDKMIILKNSGKSLFVIISMVLFGRPMNLTDNITYIPTGDEIVKKFSMLNYNCLLVDEAAKDMRSINWQSKSQQGVTTKAQTDRFKNNWIFLNIPNFNELTKSLKQTSIKFRAVVLYRTATHARVVIHMKSRNWRDDDPWHDKIANEEYKKAQKRNNELTNETMLKIERRLPNTIMDFIVPNLELILPEVTAEYETLKTLSREDEDLAPLAKKVDIWKGKYEKLMATVAKAMYYNELNLGAMQVTKGELAKKLGISGPMLNKYIDMDLNKFEKTRGIDKKEAEG